MARERQVAGGGRAVEIAPDRLEGWYARFAVRNEGVRSTELTAETVTVIADNGVVAVATVPFGPLKAEGTTAGLAVAPLIEHALISRRIALLLVRRGGHSVGIARGGVIVQSRTDRHLVQGRSAAGGWSQQRFARRREGQARVALRSAAEDAFEVLVPQLSEVDAVVLGGDRRALESLREDRRLAPLFQRAEPRVLDIAEPRRTVLEDAAERAVAVAITLSGP
ncbi:acVLRF1 family peptidyl-tRNA hydrolase [Amycolatopsis decaplanina]|uniref:acVLRF1 family peptidyl-tRNA hydrolase n=1 Tax=Amycolatopsis decaplanina TaxID=208441 RepID=UPI0005868A34|nr:acVLRF1 family peptidyl-tRNA hydrolase [Amycolatopsis decaplanina]